MKPGMGAIFVRDTSRKPPTAEPMVPDSFFERFGPDTASVSRDALGGWAVTTFSDLGRWKRQRQADQLRWKRSVTESQRVPLYVWVFHCPGFSGCYKGWWAYLIGRAYNGGKYFNSDLTMRRRLMALFPLVEPDLFDSWQVFDQWKRRFARRYCCRDRDGRPRKHAGRIQGKAPVWAEFYGEHLQALLGRAGKVE